MNFDISQAVPVSVRIPIPLGNRIVTIIRRNYFMFLYTHLFNRTVSQLLCRIVIIRFHRRHILYCIRRIIDIAFTPIGATIIFIFYSIIIIAAASAASRKPKTQGKNHYQSHPFLTFLHYLPPIACHHKLPAASFFYYLPREKSTVHTLYDGFYAIPIPQWLILL